MKTKIISIIFLSLLLIACGDKIEEKGSPEYIDSINTWHSQRIESLTKKDGWLSLAGLYWLKEGENSFGTNKTNDLVFPKGEEFMGKLIFENNKVKLIVNEGVEILVDSTLSNETILTDDSAKPSILTYKSLVWFIIKRQDKYGVRLKDTENELLSKFNGIDRFPVNSDWRFNAEWIAYNPVKVLEIPNILGQIEIDTCYGYIKFIYEGKEYTLDAQGKKDNLFIVFADQTNGEESYGAGRFLAAIKKGNRVDLDFNKSYNPPCSFTKYATCPLPPDQNRLKIKITAGEKYSGSH